MCPENEANANDKVPMLTPREVAMLLHVHLNTIRRWSDRGLIRAYRINRRGDRRFRRDDVARLLRQHEERKRNPGEVGITWR
jgi:excisionase family DNA binding protein